MNITFFIKKKKLEEEFNKICKNENIVGINGHRILGGYRASLYNALSIKSVKLLIEVMKKFEKKFL